MKLEPVYLLAPEPPRAPISRRSLVAAVAGFATAGFVAGFAVGRRRSGDLPESVSIPTGDGELLDWAIAVQAGPEDALIDAAGRFLMTAGHVADARLKPGLERLAELVCRTDRMPSEQRGDLARVLVVLGATAPYATGMRDHLPDLRALAREVR